MNLLTRAALRVGSAAVCVIMLAGAFMRAVPPAAAPAASNPEFSSQQISRIKKATVKVLAVTHAPGAALGIQRGDAPAYVKGFGYADLSHHRSVNASTRFEIGSLTKQFTAAAILQLTEAKKLSLDDRAGKFIKTYPLASPITVRQLLWQVSGVPNYTDVPGFAQLAAHKPPSFASIVALVKSQPLHFKPGSRWEYSNTNYILLGRIIEIAARTNYDAYIKSHIFALAGMMQSGSIADEPAIADMAGGYYSDANGIHAAPKLASGWAGSAGDIVSTVNDLLKWDAALFAGKIISLQDVALMTTPGRLSNGQPSSYGFGWIIDEQSGRKRLWHNGGTFGFGASNAVLPDDHLRIVALINDVSVPPLGLSTKVFEALHPEVAKSEAVPVMGEDSAITIRAKEWLRRLQSGDIDRSQLTKQMSDALPPASVTSLQQKLRAIGNPTSFIYKGKQDTSGDTTYLYRLNFTALTATMSFTLTRHGKISGMYLRPE